MKKRGKIKKEEFKDDGRTIADMHNISNLSNLFGMKNYDKAEKSSAGNEKEVISLTHKERRAMMKAAWLLGLKTALIGTGALLGIFSLMHIIVFFWSKT